jgi:mRNA interferase HigB
MNLLPRERKSRQDKTVIFLHAAGLFRGLAVRVIARKTLRQFVDSLKGSKDQRAVRSALEAWFYEAIRADWKSPADVLKAYANASIVGPDRVVFNIKRNDYRLVVAINYRHQIVFIKWIGTHGEYNKIDVKTVKYGHKAH